MGVAFWVGGTSAVVFCKLLYGFVKARQINIAHVFDGIGITVHAILARGPLRYFQALSRVGRCPHAPLVR